jgi:isopentenyl-diphosphate delta-isomerase
VQPTTSITQRKQDHIDALLKDPLIERNQSGFDAIQLSHRALPETDYDAVDTSTEFLGRPLSFPFLISSMTGGGAGNLHQINQNLALAAESMQVAMAVGSQRAMLKDAQALKSFQLRQYAPTIPLIANIGAVQLNKGVTLEDVQRAVDTLEADALYLHLNPLQEVIQPEGDTQFSGLLPKIAQLVEHLDIPIILKEVGCGLSRQDIQRGIDAGIQWFDVAGRGGTSWSRIEAHRHPSQVENSLGELFQDWGLTTPQALQQALPFQGRAHFIASGGIRNGIDMVKSVIMGGCLCGVAAPLLEPALQDAEAVKESLSTFHQAFKTAQFLLGAATINELFLNTDLLLQPEHFTLEAEQSHN